MILYESKNGRFVLKKDLKKTPQKGLILNFKALFDKCAPAFNQSRTFGGHVHQA